MDYGLSAHELRAFGQALEWVGKIPRKANVVGIFDYPVDSGVGPDAIVEFVMVLGFVDCGSYPSCPPLGGLPLPFQSEESQATNNPCPGFPTVDSPP